MANPNERESDKGAIEEENRRIRTLRLLVDFSLTYIAQAKLPLEEAQAVVQGVRKQALRLFPEKEETFDLIYLPRFQRLMRDKYRMH